MGIPIIRIQNIEGGCSDVYKQLMFEEMYQYFLMQFSITKAVKQISACCMDKFS